MRALKPNLFIVGSAKVGTTSVYNYLKQHPKIFMSPIKEPHYFSQDFKIEAFSPNYNKGKLFFLDEYLKVLPLKEKHIDHVQKIDEYEMLFKDANNFKVIGEASSGYLFSKVAAREIYKYNPEAKIIILLRDPIERTLSHYLSDYSADGENEKNIFKALKSDFECDNKGWGITHLYIDLSLYYEQVQRYYDNFASSQILILQFDDLVYNPKNLIKDVFKFLDVEYVDINLTKQWNKTVVPRNIFVKIFKKFLKDLPPDLKTKFNIFRPYLYKSRKNIKISKEVIEYIEKKTYSNWINTKEKYL